MYIYTRIRDLREDKDLRQEDIAATLKTTQTQYSRWERGAQEIPFHHAITLAKFYRVSLDYIAGLTNKNNSLQSLVGSLPKIVTETREDPKEPRSGTPERVMPKTKEPRAPAWGIQKQRSRFGSVRAVFACLFTVIRASPNYSEGSERRERRSLERKERQRERREGEGGKEG